MARCPVTGEDAPNVAYCAGPDSDELCAACRASRDMVITPADLAPMPTIWSRLWSRLQQIVVALTAGLLLFGGTAMPVHADHNPQHNPPPGLSKVIKSGKAGGQWYANKATGRVTWGNKATGMVAIFGKNGEIVSYYKCRDCVTYLAKDAASHGAAPVSRSTANAVLKTAAKGGTAATAGAVAGRAGSALAGASGVGLLGDWSIYAGCMANPGLCWPKSGAIPQ